MTEYAEKLEALKKIMQKQGGNYDYGLVERAFYTCVNAHEGQVRLSGEAYYNHPYQVAIILVQLGMDSESIAAGLLHDVLEDTAVTPEELQKQFGKSVFMLVDGVTKLGSCRFPVKSSCNLKTCAKCLLPWRRIFALLLLSWPTGCTICAP